MDVHNLQGAQQSFMERINNVENKLDTILKLCSTSSFSPVNDNYKSPTCFSTSRRPANERQQYPDNHKYCFYHWRYGQNAHKCVKPCSWSYEHNQGSLVLKVPNQLHVRQKTNYSGPVHFKNR